MALLSWHIYTEPADHTFTDTSGKWGCGATWKEVWFQVAWSKEWVDINIATKELVPIVLAVAMWGAQWHSKHIQFHSDNMAVIEIVKAKSIGSKDNSITHLLQCLHFFCTLYYMQVSAVHIPGIENSKAGVLSRNDKDLFLSLSSKVSSLPTIIPATLWVLVVESQLDWLSDNWRDKPRSIWYCQQHPRGVCMCPETCHEKH